MLFPGIFGSWSTALFCDSRRHVRLFEIATGSRVPKTWTLDTILFKCKALVEELRNGGLKPIGVPYDWRLSITQSVKTLIASIDLAKKRYSVPSVDVVAHSMGALIVRSYVQSAAYRGDINKLVMLGAPNQGGVDAYYGWEGGDMVGGGWDYGLRWSLPSKTFQRRMFIYFAQRCRVRPSIHAIRQGVVANISISFLRRVYQLTAATAAADVRGQHHSSSAQPGRR